MLRPELWLLRSRKVRSQLSLRLNQPIEMPQPNLNCRSMGAGRATSLWAWPAQHGDLKQALRYPIAGSMESVMANDYPGRIAEIELNESAAICVEQIDDEITVSIASVVGVHFELTADQALKLSRALTVAAENAAKFRASR